MSHNPVLWFLLGAALSAILVAPVYYWQGHRDGRASALRSVEQRAWKAGR